MIKVKDIVKDLLELDQEKDISISVDISTCEDDCYRRAFTNEYFGVNDKDDFDITLLFNGYVNE